MKNIIFWAILNFSCFVGFAFGQGSYVSSATMQGWNNANSSFLDTAIFNQINSDILRQDLFRQMLYRNMRMSNLKAEVGAARRREGKISTKIVFSDKNSMIGQNAQNIKDAQERAKYLSVSKNALDVFHSAMAEHRFTKYDFADAKALAFVTAYQIYSDEFPGLKRLAALRRDIREDMLANNIFQGTPDDEKQPEYEWLAIQTIFAFYASQQAKNPVLTESQRNLAQKTAKKIAEGILEKLSSKPVGTIEMTADGFGNKAERLLKTGNAGTTFERRNTLEIETQNSQEERLYKSYIERFDAEVVKRAGSTNDLAFCNAVAFDLAFIADNNGKSLNTAQLRWVYNEMVKDITVSQQAISYQSLTNSQWQIQYERLAIRTMKMYDRYLNLKKNLNDKSGNTYDQLGRSYSLTFEIENLRSEAQGIMSDVFSPRVVSNYELLPDGFRKVR